MSERAHDIYYSSAGRAANLGPKGTRPGFHINKSRKANINTNTYPFLIYLELLILIYAELLIFLYLELLILVYLD